MAMGESAEVGERMARLASAVERARAEARSRPRRPVGEELEAVIRLGEEFPAPVRRGELRYPVLKRLIATQE